LTRLSSKYGIGNVRRFADTDRQTEHDFRLKIRLSMVQPREDRSRPVLRVTKPLSASGRFQLV
jgi:hypothetical protein